jgi:hypothetical protein
VPTQVYEFDARLVGLRGVRRRIGVRSDQTLVDLHYALQEAFEWDDDHLYAFWPGEEFWRRKGTEYVHPFSLEHDPLAPYFEGSAPRKKTADTRLDRLRLRKGQKLAYLFDFGDEWRVRLTLRDIRADDGEPHPRVLESVGEAPPQYPDYDEADAA